MMWVFPLELFALSDNAVENIGPDRLLASDHGEKHFNRNFQS